MSRDYERAATDLLEQAVALLRELPPPPNCGCTGFYGPCLHRRAWDWLAATYPPSGLAPPPAERATHERCEHPCMLCRQDPDTVLPCARPMGHPEGFGCACAAHLVASAPVERAGVARSPVDELQALLNETGVQAYLKRQWPSDPTRCVHGGPMGKFCRHCYDERPAASAPPPAPGVAQTPETLESFVARENRCPLCSGAGEYQEETATGFVASRCLSCNGTGRAAPGTAGEREPKAGDVWLFAKGPREVVLHRRDAFWWAMEDGSYFHHCYFTDGTLTFVRSATPPEGEPTK